MITHVFLLKRFSSAKSQITTWGRFGSSFRCRKILITASSKWEKVRSWGFFPWCSLNFSSILSRWTHYFRILTLKVWQTFSGKRDKEVRGQENSPQSSEGGLVQVGLLSVGVETQLGPPGPPVPTPVKVFWLQNFTWNPGENTWIRAGLEPTWSEGRTRSSSVPQHINSSVLENVCFSKVYPLKADRRWITLTL